MFPERLMLLTLKSPLLMVPLLLMLAPMAGAGHELAPEGSVGSGTSTLKSLRIQPCVNAVGNVLSPLTAR